MKRLYRIAIAAAVGTCLLIAIIVVAVVVKKDATVEMGPLDGPWDNIRLPENIQARKYRMYLDINWQDMDYRGTNEVTMDVTGEDTRYFLIHSRGLEIDRAATTLAAVGEDGEETPLTVMRSFMDKDKKPDQNHDFYIVESKSAVAAGTYKMKISFSGKVQTNRLTGMYRSKYTRKLPGREPDSAVIYQISTDFEPVDARTAFPCFDEPAQKAKWETDISVTFPAGINPDEYNIISNMPLKDKYITNDQTLSGAFKESIEMSTYLVCFAVSDFHYQEGVYTRDDNSTVALRVFTRREDTFQETAKYAVKVTSPILKKYEEFYKVRFPLPKLDQIALPEFNSGAMENWGIITYRESSLLYDPVKSSNNEKQRVCAVIAHEIAHQWFGNTVTMDWWNDLWLNEGFASFVEYYGIDAAEPEWNILNFFYPDEVTTAMNFDSSPSSHPISVNVSSPDELNGLFDTISYRKGSSINWMMLKFIGEEKFKEGLQIYIERHQGGNAKMVELFDALNEAADDNIDVKEIMMTWTMQMGFPLVTVSLDTSTAGKTMISVSQERFLVGEAADDDHSNYGYKWWVPFTYVTEGTPQSAITWMDPDNNEGSAEVVVDGILTWVKGNADGNYYYITNYDEAVWGQLKTEIEKTGNGALSNTNDRTSLIYDAFRLAEIGKVKYDTALDMTLYSTNEQEYVVLSRVLGEVLKAADKIQDDADAYTKSKEYVKKMLKPRVDELGWLSAADEPITAPKLRDMAIRNYCKAVDDSNDATVREALEKFADFAAHSDDVKPEIKDVFTTVLRTAILYDDENKNWHKMWNLLQTSDWEADQRIYIAALARTTNQDLLRKMISESWEPKTKGDPWRYLYYVNFQGDNYDLGWEILKQDWNRYAEKYNGTSFTMGYLIEIPEAFKTQEKYDEVKAFFESKADNIGSGLKTVAETLAKIKSNIEWSKNYASTVTDWFKQLP